MLSKENFNSLIELGIAKGLRDAQRFCLKNQRIVKFEELPLMKCWECPHFVVNHGACDPI